MASIATVVIVSATPSAARATPRDLDRDGLSNRYEIKRSHTQPRRSDTDRDRLRDGFEVRRSHTDPLLKDTDGDGVKDGDEVRRFRTSPRRKDTDRDGTSDGLELLSGTDPLTRGKKKGQPLPAPDLTPPETTITSGPSGVAATGEATLGFSSSEAGSSFECRLDGAVWASCSSPKSYIGLAGGSHAFEVRATDAAANTDSSPAMRTWMVTVTPSPEPPPPPAPSGCTTTLQPGANVGSAVQAAVDGSTVCLSEGTYGRVTSSADKRGVTVRSAPGQVATVQGFLLRSASGITLRDLDVVRDGVFALGSQDITVENVHIHGIYRGSTCASGQSSGVGYGFWTGIYNGSGRPGLCCAAA